MSDYKLINRAIDMFREATPPLGSPIEEYRAKFDNLCMSFEVPADTSVEELNANGVPAFKVTAAGVAAKNILIHFHSGGYVMGSAKGYLEFASRLSAIADAPVVVPDYRLAPENPYPAPLEDGLAVYHWLLDQYAPGNILISGDSAGGGLTLALLMSARDQGIPLPAAAVVISPLTDLAAEGASYQENKDTDPLIDRDLAVGMGVVYIGDRDPKQTPLASPLYGDHKGLPPLFFLVSASEVLRDDSIRVVDSILASGGEAELVQFEGMVHIWTIFPFLPETTEAMTKVKDFVAKHLPAQGAH
ncbi:MAG: alpha/beta hydrolase [Porticoccaceae bacterium]